MKSQLYKFFTTITLCLSLTLSAQIWPTDTIKVSINSGNPRFPFPQFQEYTAGKSLAKYNAEGVTHADMEKAMREGYQIMMHRALYTGKVHGGVKYIIYNHSSVPQNYGTFVSEGDGYALLAAAYFGDKTTFDGLWMWVHDNRLSGVKQYYNCADLRAAYPYGKNLPGWKSTETDNLNTTNIHSAADADFDIAMALLMAHKQWGDHMGIDDACGNPISYKTEALSMIKALVDTVYYSQSATGIPAGVRGYLTGDIGIDGYVKSGNTWGELTNWRSSAANTIYPWAKPIPDPTQVKSKYVDYIAPAYFNEFAKFLEQNGGTSWQISQFKRAEASSDWTIGQMFAKGFIASAGTYQMTTDDGSNITFGSFAMGEDFRLSWRTILNYVWHGDATSSWDPVTHSITASPNTYQKDMGIRHADFLKYPRTLPSASSSAVCSLLGASPDPSSPSWKGVAQVRQQYTPTGAVLTNYGVNWMVGTGAPAAVASGDVDLLAEIYRQNEILWDDVSESSLMTEDERYLKSTPKYFHGWFRLLGMLTASGNLHAPASMDGSANVKAYLSVNKTYASAGDLVTYTLSYRNYGSVAATAVKLSIPIGIDYEFVSASNSGTLSAGTINWNVGTVPGFQTSTGIAPTQGTVSFTVSVKPLATVSRACLVGTVSASNAASWQSNAYPNNATYTMERNCVDLLPSKALALTKTSSKTTANVGDELTLKLQFGNTASSTSLLNGGRDKVVVSYANYVTAPSLYQFHRIWHTAQEAYINLGNYRVSYFLNDSIHVGKHNAATNPSAWDIAIDNQSDLNRYGYNPLSLPADQQIKLSIDKLAKGMDANGRWNQKVVTQFAQVLTAPTSHIYDKIDSDYLIHKGVRGPSSIRTRMESRPFSLLTSKLTDDWSYSNSVASPSLDGQSSRFSPVSPTYTNAATAFAPVVVNNFSKDVCNADVANFSKVLVEEFDGYTWRRVGGSAPVYGNEASNVVVYDTIPKHLTWVGFTNQSALGGTATYTAAPNGADYTGIVKWSSTALLVGDSASLAYKVVVKDPPCVSGDVNFVSRAWIKSDKDAPSASGTNLVVRCTVTEVAHATLADVIEVYPNPAQDEATVDLSQYRGKVYSVELKSTAGQVLHHTKYSKDQISFATQSLATGVYLVEIKTDEGIIVKKLNIVR